MKDEIVTWYNIYGVRLWVTFKLTSEEVIITGIQVEKPTGVDIGSIVREEIFELLEDRIWSERSTFVG